MREGRIESACRGGMGVVIVGIDAKGKSRARLTVFFLLTCVRRASRSMVCWLGVASSMEVMLRKVVGRGRGAGGFVHSEAAVGQ